MTLMRVSIVVMAALLSLSGAAKIRQVQFVHRHGDRAPLTVLPSNQVNWEKELGTSPAQLTGLGMNQAYQFGDWLRKRYVESGLLDKNYKASEVYVRSTDLDRTLMTASIILQSLYKGSYRYDDINQVFVNDTIRVPVHTLAIRNNVLQAVDLCSKYLHEQLPALYDSEEWRSKEKQEEEFLKKFKEASGFESTPLKSFYHYYDPVYVQHVHGLLESDFLKQNIDHIVDLADYSEFMQKNQGGKYIGGTFLYRFAENMRKMVSGDSSAWKYVQYSGHDSTVMAVLSALKIFNTPGLNKIPPYASALIIELWEEDDGAFTVRVMFRNGVTGQVSTVQGLPTRYDEFLKLLEENSMTDQEWCEVCGDHWDITNAPDECLRMVEEEETSAVKMYRSLAIGFIVAFSLTLAALVFFVMRNQSRRRRTKNSSGMETSLLNTVSSDV